MKPNKLIYFSHFLIAKLGMQKVCVYFVNVKWNQTIDFIKFWEKREKKGFSYFSFMVFRQSHISREMLKIININIYRI